MSVKTNLTTFVDLGQNLDDAHALNAAKTGEALQRAEEELQEAMQVLRRSEETAAPVARLLATLSRLHLEPLLAPLANAMNSYVEAHARDLTALIDPEPLTPAETAALAAVGALGRRRSPDFTPLINTALKHASLLETALPLKDAAQQLGVKDSRLRQRIQEGTLFAIRLEDGRTWAVPAFQFTERGELPGLRIAMKGVRRDAHPVEVANFFQSPQPDLEDDDGSAMTPLQWLAEGRDPQLVQDLATGI